MTSTHPRSDRNGLSVLTGPDPDSTQPLPIIEIDLASQVAVSPPVVVSMGPDEPPVALADDEPRSPVDPAPGDLLAAPGLLVPPAGGPVGTDPEASSGAEADPAQAEADAGHAAVDPRLRARRAEVRRANARRRRRRRRITVLVVAALVVAAAVAFSPLLSVRSISVAGVRHLAPEQVVAASGLSEGDSMITLDTDAAESSVLATRWVRRVSIDRRLPWSVDIVVNERTLVATVADRNGAQFLVGDDGVILERVDVVAPRDVPVVNLPDITLDDRSTFSAAVAASIAEAGALPTWLAQSVSGTIIDPAGRITFALDGGVTLRFGDADDAERKLAAAQTLLGSGVAPSGICQVDVSVAAAPTLRRAPDCG